MFDNTAELTRQIKASEPGTPDRIAILIKTINRAHQLLPTLQSIFTYCDVPFRLYIGDDGTISEDQKNIYAVLRDAGHFVREYDKPIAFTSGLNDLFSATEHESLVLRMDDDMRFTEETRISVLCRIMNLVASLGALGGAERQIKLYRPGHKGQLRVRQAFLVNVEGTLYKVKVAPGQLHYTIIDGLRFAVVNHTTNFLLIRHRALEQISWNEDLWAQGEHMDFSLRLAKAGWLIGFTPDSVHNHCEDGIAAYTGLKTDRDALTKEQVYARDHGIQYLDSVDFAALVKDLNRRKPSFSARIERKLKTTLRRGA
jgi:GT2 family glycosyltransferase